MIYMLTLITVQFDRNYLWFHFFSDLPLCLDVYSIQRVCRYIEPLPVGSSTKFEFENLLVGQAIPSNFIPAIEKGFKEAANS